MKYVSKISDQFVEKYRNKLVPWGPVGYITYKRTYSRDNEEWWQTIKRCCNGILEIGAAFIQDDIEMLYDCCFNLKCTFSGRALWQLGTSTVRKIGADSLINCWFVDVTEAIHPFCFTFNELMLGGGVGFNITPQSVYTLPIVKHDVDVYATEEHDVDFIVPDNREGWVELLRQVLSSFYYGSKKRFIYSTACIRPRGKPITSFGGTASGPDELVKGIDNIVRIMKNRVGGKLTPVDCLDIMNIIGSIVVAGNVRRSAELAIGDAHDRHYLDAKNWNKQTLPPWRQMSNNTVECSKFDELPVAFWEGYEGNGEPYGLFNKELCQNYGRLVDGGKADYAVNGLNPCGEIPLASYECCNLSEIFLPNITNRWELQVVARMIYQCNKAISCMQYGDPRTQEVVDMHHRLGIGLTGVLQAPWTTIDDLDSCYQFLRACDAKYSGIMGCKESIKLTTVKPSGTLSLLAGVTPGIHPAYAPYYIRRIRFSADDELVDLCKSKGYDVEPVINIDGSRDLNTMVVSFPIKTPSTAICAKDLSIVDQLENQVKMQTYWSDNAVSMTGYYKPDELELMMAWLAENYDSSVKSASFLLHSKHGFQQAPLEEISEAKYHEMVREPIQHITTEGDAEIDECLKGGCPIR